MCKILSIKNHVEHGGMTLNIPLWTELEPGSDVLAGCSATTHAK